MNPRVYAVTYCLFANARIVDKTNATEGKINGHSKPSPGAAENDDSDDDKEDEEGNIEAGPAGGTFVSDITRVCS